MYNQGLVQVRPVSIQYSGTDVRVVRGGKIVFTAVTTMSLDGIFTSTYDNYLVVIRSVLSGITNWDIRGRMRVAGVDDTATNYSYQFMQGDGATTTPSRATAQSFVRMGYTSSQNSSGDQTYVFGPAIAQPTAVRHVCAIGADGARLYDHASVHTLSTAYDGMTFYPGGDTMTGSMVIYGFSQ